MTAQGASEAPLSHGEVHRLRKRAILSEHPQITKLYGTDSRTQWYGYALMALQLTLAWWCSQSWVRALLLAATFGPYVDNGILVFMHEATHMLVFKSVPANRMVSIFANSVMVIPISEIFRQHHARHHYGLGDTKHDVDVPTPGEISWCGASSWRKFVWVALNMIILSARSLQRLPVHTDLYLIANWVACIGFGFLTLLWSRPALAFLLISALNSQGFHPANTRLVQRHVHDGTPHMMQCKGGNDVTADQLRPATYSYYGIVNAFTLNVGYHIEHHDFCTIPWTRLAKLRRIAGPKWYPDTYAHPSRGLSALINFVLNRNITLADVVANHRD